MEHYFSIGEAARAVHMTSETLRHYDRIGLVEPSRKDAWTNYRYYTEQDLVRLQAVRALHQMDLPLQEIKRVLEAQDLKEILEVLSLAERRAEEKIAALEYSRAKIQLAKADYEKKLRGQGGADGPFLKRFPARVLLLSDTLEAPSLDNLWNYLSHFYDKIEPEEREGFAFEDLAGIYTEAGRSRMFAVCIRYRAREGLKVLPQGMYLCANCTEESREAVLAGLMRTAKEQYGAAPAFAVQRIVVTGILNWDYQAQVFVGQGT